MKVLLETSKCRFVEPLEILKAEITDPDHEFKRPDGSVYKARWYKEKQLYMIPNIEALEKFLKELLDNSENKWLKEIFLW